MSSGSDDELESPPPAIAQDGDIPSLAKYIKSDKCRRIIFMLGAGVSTSAGIPDFRSPKTGLYANLKHLNLPSPEDVFDINFFRRNPKPFYKLAKEFSPGTHRPTITHSFVRLIHEKGLLLKCFTQNIDTLERRAGIPEDKLVEAHGSFASQSCIACKTPYDGAKMAEAIEKQKIAYCPKCQRGLVKPDIVFFGESLPVKFHSSLGDFAKADLLIIIGTSLTVHPFANLVTFPRCPRVFINLEPVPSFRKTKEDFLLLGRCDEVIEQLTKELAWHDELLQLWNETEIRTPKAKATRKGVEALTKAFSKKITLKEGVDKGKSTDKDTQKSSGSSRSGKQAGDKSKPQVQEHMPEISKPQGKPADEAEQKEGKVTVSEGKL